MKKFSLILIAVLFISMIAVLPASAVDPVDVCKITEKSADIDGVVSAYEWDDATKLTLNISDTSTWSADGAGIVGTTGYLDLGHTDDDFSTSLSIMADKDYLYLLLTRKDSTLNFATDNFHTPYASDCALMWFYDNNTTTEYGLQLLAADKSGTPHIGYFNGDPAQATSVDLTADGSATAVTKVTGDTYVMEVKVKFSAMDDFTYDMIKGGSIGVTYCAVNICEEGWDSDDGAHALWGTSNYQAQYKGVGAWDLSPKAELTAQTTFAPAETEAPVAETEAPATETPTTDETTAPTTADFSAVAVFVTCVTAAGAYMISRKKK